MPLVTAHLGHVLVDVPLFLGPVVLLLAALYVSSWVNRRNERGRGAGG